MFLLLFLLMLSVFGVRLKPRSADYWPGCFARLVEFLEGRGVRVLRSIRACPSGGADPLEYLALGHDILAVGLARTTARAEQKMKIYQFKSAILDSFVPVLGLFWGVYMMSHLVPVPQFSLSFLLFLIASGSAIAGAAVLVRVFRSFYLSRLSCNRRRLILIHRMLIGAPQRLFLRALNEPVTQTARLLYRLKAAERQQLPESKSPQAFPGAARF